MVDETLLNHLSVLRDFGRIYTEKILDGNAKSKSDLKLSQIKALYAFREDDCLSMKELAANIGVKLPNMTMMIDNLEQEGLVERARDDKDRRKVLVQLTAQGKRVRNAFLQHRHNIAKEIFGHLNEQEKTELSQALQTVCRVLEKAFTKKQAGD